MKQMFMRYLSHEIRTPLNSVYVGLTIMLTELKRLTVQGQQQRNLLETAMDTQKACQSAVDILDDMILYDRITNGFIGLDKTLFNPWALISDVVGPFRMQVQISGLLTSIFHHWFLRYVCMYVTAGQRRGHRSAACEQHPSSSRPAPLRRPGQGRTSGPQPVVQCAQVHQPQRNYSGQPIHPRRTHY